MTTTSTGRHYPMACRSINCGQTQCPAGCPELPALQRFQAWQRATEATQPDPVWAPTYWEAQRAAGLDCERSEQVDPWDDGKATTAERIAWGKPYRATRATGVDGQRY
jgi:hypothetical protein